MRRDRKELYRKPSLFHYRIAQVVSWFAATFVFRRKVLRNEIRGVKGPFVVIANHQAALDFVNLIGMAARPMSFVISYSFYRTLPIKGFLDKLGVIPKQQFQSSVTDMKKMKTVVDMGQPLVIYPAGLMCEDGVSTPIPQATYKFLKWLGVDVYVARSAGSYFVMPKWTKLLRPGRTELDIYRLFTKEELAATELSEVKRRCDEALLYDAYREQENIRASYAGGSNIEGLQNVLYKCPHCGEEFSMAVRDKNTIYCRLCGYAQKSDAMGFMHLEGNVGRELRYVSDWNSYILSELERSIREGESLISMPVSVRMLGDGESIFTTVGHGSLSLSAAGFVLEGSLNGEEVSISIPIVNIPTLPFSPGKYLELQRDKEIFRCVPEDGRMVMKTINMLKVFHRLSLKEPAAR